MSKHYGIVIDGTKPNPDKLKSAPEKRIFWQLEALNVKYAYETTRLPVLIPVNYIPDFVFQTKSGKFILLEVKGALGGPRLANKRWDRRKYKCAFEQNKDKFDMRILFENDEKLGKVLTASKWCEKIGVPYHIGNKIPQEWLDE